LTFAIDEGPLYRFGDINIACNVPGLESEKLRPLLVTRPSAVFNGNALDKSSEILATELAKLGFPFATSSPPYHTRCRRRRIDVVFTIDQGPRTYVERIESTATPAPATMSSGVNSTSPKAMLTIKR